MKLTITVTATVLAFAATAAAAQPRMPDAGEMPFAEAKIKHDATPPLSRAAVRATALARDLEVGDVARPTAPSAAPAAESRPRLAVPKTKPLSGESA